MAEPDPSNVAPWYLRNINQALELNEATGQVFVRTGFEGNIIISGNVTIPGNVDAHVSEIGTSGELTVPWMPVSIDGNSNVTIAGGNVNAAVTGTVVYAGLTSSRDEVEIGDDIKKRLQLWRYANGTPSTLTLAVAYTSTNADLLWKMGWEELTN